MAQNNNNDALQKELDKLLEDQKKQGEAVREMKAKGASKQEVASAVEALNKIKAAVQDLQKKIKPVSTKPEFPREAFSKLMTSKFFINQAFEIYGGVAGLYDLGPPGCAVKANLLSLWRQHFVLNENMLEIDSVCVTPEAVLTTSGHTAKFADLMVKDVKNGSCYRADHLLEKHLEKLLEDPKLDAKLADEYKFVIAQADALGKEQMGVTLKKYGVTAPDTGNDLSDPEPFNLMFSTYIGPTGQEKGYLRPETAQGIFVNFRRLLEYNGGRLPFAAAQIGQAFRNEIAPRSGLLRVREFTLAEIEHFVDPEDKSHPKFANVKDLELNLFPREKQLTTKVTEKLTLEYAVTNKIIANETLGYFIGRTYLFLVAAGINPSKLRFRQHLKDEMAHYATDCWDAEIQNSYGWVESVGIADRACFDLKAHGSATSKPLTAFVDFKNGPQNKEVVEGKVQMKHIAATYKLNANDINKTISAMEESGLRQMKEEMDKNGFALLKLNDQEFKITKEMIEFKVVKKTVLGEPIVPGVIEPSFGIGRILYSILEHAYYVRSGDEQRNVLALPPIIAPVKASVLPLVNQPEILKHVTTISNILADHAISFKVDDAGVTIGRKYARTDEIGVPFGITIDEKTGSTQSVTLRERDSTNQVRVPVDELGNLLQRLCNARITWAQVWEKYPHVNEGKQE